MLVMLSVALTSQTFAQFAKGDKLLNVGIGLGVYGRGGLPIGGSFEYGVTDKISVGVQADYYSWKYNYGFSGTNYGYKYTFLPIAVRGSYHVNDLLKLGNDKVDLYAGLALGYYISSFTYDGVNYGGTYSDGYGSRAFIGLHLGGRYYFKPNIAGFAELGAGVSALKLGVTFKF